MSIIETKAYNKPPVTEAVIGINIDPPFGPKEMSKLVDKLKSDYPNFENIPNYDVKVNITGNENDARADTKLIKLGETYRFSRENMTQIVVITSNSIAVSQLAPYKNWEDLFNRFVAIWNIKTRLMGHKTVSRVGVRYVNRIDIPTNNNEFINENDYLNIYPFLPKNFKAIIEYAIQVTVPYDPFEVKLNSAVIPSPLIGHISFLIDIDLYRDPKSLYRSYPLPQRDEDLFKFVNDMRRYKNEIFESLINNQTRSLF